MKKLIALLLALVMVIGLAAQAKWMDCGKADTADCFSTADPYQLEAEAFSRAVLGTDNDLMPLEDTLANMQTLDKLYSK